MNARLRVAALAALCTAAPLLVALPAEAAAPPAPIAYVLDPDGDGLGALVVRDLADRTVRTVLAEGDHYVEAPDLSADGRTIAFATDIGSDTADLGIAVIGVDGSGFRRLTDPPLETEHTLTYDTDPSWVGDGTLVFGRVTEDDRGDSVRGTLHRVPSTGGPVTAVARTNNAISPDVDPSGTQVTFISLAPTNDGSGSVMRQSLVAPTPEPLAVGGYGYDPAWSPDGTRVVFATYGEGFPSGLAVRAVADPMGPITRLAGVSDLIATFAPFWLPDSRSVVYSRYGIEQPGATVDLWAADADGSRNGPFLTSGADEVYGSAAGRVLPSVTGGSASTYVPVEPVRVLDTRAETAVGVEAPGKVGPRGTVRLQIGGRETASGTVPATATAVILNVTATGATASTDVRAYPSGTAVPEVSNLNLGVGRTVPNLVTVPLGADGAVVLRNSAGSVHLLADLAGWYVPGDQAAGFTPLEPRRILDTRAGTTVGVSAAGRIGAGGVVPLKVTGELPVSGGGTSVQVPATATAVILNVTGTAPTRSTDVRAYPHGSAEVPVVSNLNLTAGTTAPNLVIARVGEDGRVDLRNSAGEVHLIADIAGWFGPEGQASFVPAGPVRLLDTREGLGAAPIATGPGRALDMAVAGARGVPADALAAVLNVTATGVTASTDVRAYPSTASSTPVVSNLNLVAGATRANAAVVKTGTDGEVRLRNGAGSVHLLADLAGWFAPTR